MSRDPVIVGVADVPLHERGRAMPGTTILGMQRDCALEALGEAGLALSDVDGLCVAGFWGMAESPAPGAMATLQMAEYLGLHDLKYLDNTNTGGSAFVVHAGHAAEMIRAGICDTVLILYGSLQKSESSRKLGGRRALYTQQFERVAGLPTPVGGYAMAAQRHMAEFGTTRETLAEIAVSTRAWAAMNDNAAFRDPMTVDDVLGAPGICDPLGRFDCCLITDGGGAVVMTTAERAKDLKTKPINVLGHGECTSHYCINYMPDMARLDVARESSTRAYAMAGRTAADMDLAMIYDSFTITVLLSLEAIGLCKPGEGKDFVAGGRIGPGGEFPVNTNGGGLSYCHPGMYGIFTIIEATRQLRGDAGERQQDGLVHAVCHGTGGVLASGATLVLSNDKG